MKNLPSNNESDVQVRCPEQGYLNHAADKQKATNQDTALNNNNAAPNNTHKGAVQEDNSIMKDSNQSTITDTNTRANVNAQEGTPLEEDSTGGKVAQQKRTSIPLESIQQAQEQISNTITEEEFLAEALRRINAGKEESEKGYYDLDQVRGSLLEPDGDFAKELLDYMASFNNGIYRIFERHRRAKVESMVKDWTRLLKKARLLRSHNAREGCRFRLCTSPDGIGVLLVEHIGKPVFIDLPEHLPFAYLVDSVENESVLDRSPVVEVETIHTWIKMGITPSKKQLKVDRCVIFEENGFEPIPVNIARVSFVAWEGLDYEE